MRMLGFGMSLAAILNSAVRGGRTRSNVLWHVPRPKEEPRRQRSSRHQPYDIIQAFGFNHGKDYSHRRNGEREVARRLRQIQRGQLKAENGLVT